MQSGTFLDGDLHGHAYPGDPDDDADLDDYSDSEQPQSTPFGVKPSSVPQPGRYPMRSHHTAIGVCCLHCGSSRTTTSHLGRRIGSAVGTLAGAATATARTAGGAQLGAELGAVLGTPAGPAGTTIGAIAGAVLGAMAGAAAGCAIGAALGEAIDAKILHNHRCLQCGRSFSVEDF
jgi:hypothetical protein